MMILDKFYNDDKFIDTDDAYKNALGLISANKIHLLDKNPNCSNTFTEEIFPIIQLAKYLNYKEILFCGKQQELHTDGKICNFAKNIIGIECTTSMNQRYNNMRSEYIHTAKDKSCFSGPHSAIKSMDDTNISFGDIMYSGSKNKREFIEQKDISYSNNFTSGLVIIDKYIQDDIKAIKGKIELGNAKGYYKNYILLLVCDHALSQGQIEEYSSKIKEKWYSFKNNPFKDLFVVNYDYMLFHEIIPILNTEMNINSLHYPISIATTIK